VSGSSPRGCCTNSISTLHSPLCGITLAVQATIFLVWPLHSPGGWVQGEENAISRRSTPPKKGEAGAEFQPGNLGHQQSDRHCSLRFPPLKSLPLIRRRALVFFNLFIAGTRRSPHLRLPAKGKSWGLPRAPATLNLPPLLIRRISLPDDVPAMLASMRYLPQANPSSGHSLDHIALTPVGRVAAPKKITRKGTPKESRPRYHFQAVEILNCLISGSD
jgi:hypothetical protein